ncbi:MAG: carbohydrate ABC transporter permease [Bacteroidota bacterium]
MIERRTFAGKIGRGLGLLFFLCFALFPIYWMVLTSLKPDRELFSPRLNYWPLHPTFQHYRDVLTHTSYGAYFLNSLTAAGVTSLLVLVIAVFGGYAFARFNFRGKQASLLVLLATQMFPGVVLVAPLFVLFSRLHLLNSLPGLIFIYAALNIPFAVFLMRGYFEDIPKELEEAAYIDGCGFLAAIWRVLVPTLWPGLVATVVFVFTAAWSELIFAVMFINSERLKTIPIGLTMYVSKFNVSWGMMMAATTMALIPVALLFGYIQRYLIRGLTMGAVKG